MPDLLVSDMMTKHVHLLRAQATVREAAATLSEINIGSIIVTTDDVATGIISERDIVSKVIAVNRSPELVKIGEIMTSPIMTIMHNASPFEALQTMIYKHIRHLPVTDAEGQIIGMLSIRDLVRAVLELAI